MYQTIVARYTPFLEQVLTPGRLRHSLGVMQVMGELAPIYALDPEKALVTGLLHDAAKDLPPEQVQQIVDEAGIIIHEPADENYLLYLHGPVGEYFVHQQLGITDRVILDAIRLHTYYGVGEDFHSIFDWCLRFADILEPNRNWADARPLREGTPRLRQLVYSGQWIEGAFVHLEMIIKILRTQACRSIRICRSIRQEFSPSPIKP